MNKMTKMFCRAIIFLDLIPRYGRIYTWIDDVRVVKWVFQRYGHWGTYLLDDLGLLDKYIEFDDGEVLPL